MKFIFICGALAPGLDGVGDYTRLMAAELINKGHSVRVLALNDYYVTEYTEEKQQAGNISLMVYRLPASWKETTRLQQARILIQEYNSDWISLQFVTYAYHAKGLPYTLSASLRLIAPDAQWHIMFHEIWIGFSVISGFKDRLMGRLQKILIRKMVENIKPACITTSNMLYQEALKRSGIKASILPLFSNIPIYPVDEEFKESFLKSLDILKEERSDWRLLGIFGTLYKDDKDLENALEDELRKPAISPKKTALITFGRNNKQGKEELGRLKELFNTRIRFHEWGEQTAKDVSGIFQCLDAGISCTPPHHTGKSGVYAAMRLHGLDVILTNRKTIPDYAEVIDNSLLWLASKSADSWSVSTVSHRFLELLNVEVNQNT